MAFGMSRLANLFYSQPYDICHLETFSFQDDSVLTCVDGSMVTVFELSGVMRHYSKSQKISIIDDIANDLKETIEGDGFKIDFILDINPDNAERFVKDRIGHVKENAIRYGYDSTAINEAQERMLIENVKPELQYVVVTTLVTSLDALTSNDMYQSRKRKAYALNIPLEKTNTEQVTTAETTELFDQHKNFETKVKTTLDKWLIVKKLSAVAAMKACRDLLYTADKNLNKDWKPNVIKESLPVWRSVFPSRADQSVMGHPSIVSQLIENPFEKTSTNAFRYFDDRFITAVTRNIAGSEKKSIDDLVNAINKNIPYRIVYSIRSGTGRIKNKYAVKSSAATLVAFANPVTKNIVNACNQITDFANSGGCLVETYLTVATWGETIPEVRKRYKTLISMLRAWGGERHKLSDHPTESFLTTLPAFSRETTGTGTPSPLVGRINGALQSAPIIRPCSPWYEGEQMFLTPEGKPWCHSYNSVQNYHLTCISGSMGSGKSVQVGVTLDCHINAPGLPTLPLAGLVDYGDSGGYSLQGIKAKVSKEDQHKINHFTFTDTPDNAYNLLEPQFGYQKLTDREKSIVTAFISRICNGESETSVHGQLNDAISTLLDICLAESEKNKRVLDKELEGTPYIEQLCQTPLVKQFLEAEKNLTYLNARNALFQASQNKEGKIKHALLASARRAHTLAAPLLSDLISICKKQEADAMLGMFKVGDVKLTHLIAGALGLAVNKYPNILNRYPEQDYSELSVISINVKPIVDASSPAMKGAWFILAKGIATKHFWSHPEDLGFAHPLFKDFLLKVALLKKVLPKMYLQDEYEQSPSKELDIDIAKETKTARKYKEIIVLATQNHHGFPRDIIGLATNNFICDISGREAEDFIRNEYKLTEDEYESVKPYIGRTGIVNGLGKGILFVGRIKTTSSLIIQPIVSMLPPARVWSHASDAEDVELRTRCLEYEGYGNTCVRLGELFGYPSMKTIVNDKSKDENINASEVYMNYTNAFVEDLNRTRTC